MAQRCGHGVTPDYLGIRRYLTTSAEGVPCGIGLTWVMQRCGPEGRRARVSQGEPVVSYPITELFCQAKIIGADARRPLGRVQTGPLRLQMVEVVGRVFAESLA